MTNKNIRSNSETSSKTKTKYFLRPIIVAFFCVAILSISAYLLVVNYWQPYTNYIEAKGHLENKSPSKAIEELIALGSFLDSEQLLDTAYAQLTHEQIQASRFQSARETYLKISDLKNSQVVEITQAIKEKADNFFARMSYEDAYNRYSAIGLTSEAELCVEMQYEQLLSLCTGICGVPQGFAMPMLAGYKDADKYALAYKIETASWETEQEIQQNIALCYELGDFLDSAKHGFTVFRLFNHRFSNSNGYYFEIDNHGSTTYNIPGYRLPGYYGLYTKMTDGVLYIGSDEKQSWTNQFRFEFSDMDNTLKVYSFYANATYTLTKEY